MIDPFMAGLGTSGIVMPKTEGTVPAGNGKTAEPVETDFQTILETMCGNAETKPVSEQDEAPEIKAVSSPLTGELPGVPGVTQLAKPASPAASIAGDELLLTEGEFGEEDDLQRQTPENNEVLPAMVPEMPVATMLVSVAPSAGVEAVSEVVQTRQLVKTGVKVQSVTTENSMSNLAPNGIINPDHPENAEPETQTEMVSGRQEPIPASAGNRLPEQEPVGSQAPQAVKGRNQAVNEDSSSVQSQVRPEQVTDNTEPTQHLPLKNAAETQPSPPAKSISERATAIKPTEQGPLGLKQPENRGETTVKAARTYPDYNSGVVTSHLRKAVGEKPARQSRLPGDSLKGQGERTFPLPVRELPRQTVTETSVAKGGEPKAAMTVTQTAVLSQVLSGTESTQSTQATGLSPQQSVAPVTETVPTETPETANPSRNIVSDLNLVMAQSVLRQNPLQQGCGGKPPVLRNVNAAIQGIPPQAVKTPPTLTGNNPNPGQGETEGLELTQTLTVGSDQGTVTAGQSQFGRCGGAASKLFGDDRADDPAPVQLPDGGDSVTATVQSGSAQKEVLSSLVPPQTDKSSVETEMVSGQKPTGPEGTGASQSLEVATALPLPVAENPVQSIPEAVLKAEPVVNKQEVFSQLVEEAKLMVNQGQSEMELSLKPEHLGKLKLRIALDHQVVTAQFTVESEQVKQIIETNLVQLRKLLQDTGVQVENFSITVGQQDAGTDFSQHSNSGAHHSRAYRGATMATSEGLDYTPEVTKPVQTKSLIDLIA